MCECATQADRPHYGKCARIGEIACASIAILPRKEASNYIITRVAKVLNTHCLVPCTADSISCSLATKSPLTTCRQSNHTTPLCSVMKE